MPMAVYLDVRVIAESVPTHLALALGSRGRLRGVILMPRMSR